MGNYLTAIKVREKDNLHPEKTKWLLHYRVTRITINIGHTRQDFIFNWMKTCQNTGLVIETTVWNKSFNVNWGYISNLIGN